MRLICALTVPEDILEPRGILSYLSEVSFVIMFISTSPLPNTGPPRYDVQSSAGGSCFRRHYGGGIPLFQ
jgi:hypothetical protein